ncbi:MAG: HAD family phosphatase [Clostridia bacterium]|nr:HAD family phosphatase [Clostridia bacterium]
MQPIRLIAMDMDGTLLTRIDPSTAYIPKENADALRQAAARGIHLALASGRMPDDASFFAIDAGLPMHVISLNGGMTLDKPLGDPVDSRLLPEKTARRVLSILQETTLDIAVFGAWEVVSIRANPLSWARQKLGTYYGREGGRLVYRDCGNGVEALLCQTAKIVAMTDIDRDGLQKARRRILAECPHVEISSSWWDNFEVNPQGANKGAALTALAGRLGIPMSQVMAIGDNDNDIPMITAAGVGIAMGNATASTKAAADYITLPNDAHGVAAAIRSLAFGEDIHGIQRV